MESNASVQSTDRRQRARQNQHQIRGNAQRDIFQRRLERVLFWGSVVASSLQVVVVSAVLICTAAMTCSALPRVFLGTHCVALVMHVAQLAYHRKHPLALGADGRPLMPLAGRMPRAMFHLRSASEITWSANTLLGSFSLFDKNCAPPVYWTVFGVMLWVFAIVLGPIVLIGLFLCCLPCVLAVLPWIVPEPVRRGTSASVLRALPVLHYQPGVCDYTVSDESGQRDVRIEAEDAACSICIDEYAADAAVRVMPCGHHFHQLCVDQWLRVATTCPLCVRPIDPLDASASFSVV